MEMKTCFPFLVNPAGSFLKASFVCFFAAKNLVRKSQWGDKYLSKLYRISQEKTCVKAFISPIKNEKVILCALWEN